MQPKLGEELDSTYLMALHEVIEFTTEKRSAYAIIDVHNYFEYRYKKIGSSSVPVSSIKDLWKRLGAEFKNNPRVLISLLLLFLNSILSVCIGYLWSHERTSLHDNSTCLPSQSTSSQRC